MSTTTITAAARRAKKWHPTPPPPPSPKILNLPRRIRHRKLPKKPTNRPPATSSSNPLLDMHQSYYYCGNDDRKGKLEGLFGQEREFARSECVSVPIVLLNSSSSSSSASRSSGGRRERVENVVEEGGGGRGGFGEEKWKFQTEILRAECKFLRKERELALKKLERNRVQMQRTLQSAVQTLTSGREKIFEGKNVSAVFEEEIRDLAEKLEELQRSSGIKDLEVRNCSNFDKKAYRWQHRLEKLGGLSDEKSVKVWQELDESSLPMSMNHEMDKESCVSGPRSQNKSTDVEMLRRQMEGLSKEMLDRIQEDFGSMLSTTANSSVASSPSTSKRMQYPESTFSNRQLYQELIPYENNKCSGRCKAIMHRIVEQVRAETEQWSQMQEMLGKVREEMQELQASRNFWEDRALISDHEICCLQSTVQEWKEKALSFETKANELQTELSAVKAELQKIRTAECTEPSNDVIYFQNAPLLLLNKRMEKEKHTVICNLKENLPTDDSKECNEDIAKKVTMKTVSETMTSADVQPISLGKQLEKEKRMLLRHFKDKHRTNDNGSKQELLTNRRAKSLASTKGLVTRSPFCDIGNSSPLMR